jgi:Glycosyl transferase family 2
MDHHGDPADSRYSARSSGEATDSHPLNPESPAAPTRSSQPNGHPWATSSPRPLVSVIVPAHNARLTIVEAVASALAQTYRPLEVVVVDDGSADNTAAVVREGFDGDVHVISAPHRGRGAARNTGLAAGRGTYVQFLDADDLLAPEKVEAQIAFLEANPQYGVAYGPVEYFAADDPSHRWRPIRRDAYPSGDVLAHMVDDGLLLPISAVVRASVVRAVGGFDESLQSNEDWDLWLRIAASGVQFAFFPPDRVVARYRVRPHGPSPHPDPHLESGVQVLSKLRGELPRHLARDLHLRRAIGNWRFGYGRSVLEAGRRWAGAREMTLAIVEDPRSWDYKLAWTILGIPLGGRRAGLLIERVQRLLRTGGGPAR